MTLPSIRAKCLGSPVLVDAVTVPPDTASTPRLAVLPMGWSGALWICQFVREEIDRQAGHLDSHQVADKRVAQPLTST